MERKKPEMTLTDFQNSIMDELYFLNAYHQLEQNFSNEFDLQLNLKILWTEKMIEAQIQSGDGIFSETLLDETTDFSNLYFVATKKGLLEHNSR